MKYKVTQHDKSFDPVTVTFTLENQKELDAMATLFNCVPIASMLAQMGLETSHRMFENTNANADPTTEMCDLLMNHPALKMRNRKF